MIFDVLLGILSFTKKNTITTLNANNFTDYSLLLQVKHIIDEGF